MHSIKRIFYRAKTYVLKYSYRFFDLYLTEFFCVTFECKIF